MLLKAYHVNLQWKKLEVRLSHFVVYICVQVESVPCWMFIQWIAQMVALLDKADAKTVQGTLLRIAIDYPQVAKYREMLKKLF